MDNQLVITVKDLLLFILWGALVTFFIYLILILRRALKIVKSVHLIVDENRANIDATLDVVPDLSKHIEVITGEAAHDVQSFRATIDNIASTTESVTGTIKENQGFVSGLSSFLHTMSIGKALYDKYFGGKMKDFKETVSEVKETVSEMKETVSEAKETFEDKPLQGKE